MEKEQYNEDDLNIPLSEPKSHFDAEKYEGKRVKIMNVTRDVALSHYVPELDASGKPTGQNVYDANRTVEQPVVYIETEVVNPEEPDNPITVRQRFSLQTTKDNYGKEIVTISKHPKAKLYKFLCKMGVDKMPNPLEALKGKMVTLTTEPSKDPNDDRVFLRIVH